MASFPLLVEAVIISKVSVLSAMTLGHVFSASGAGVFCISDGLAQTVLFLPSNPAQLFTLCFVNEENFAEEMLFCKALKARARGKCMY